MITISLCMIVKDEESVIGRCLDTVKDIVDEIIIVDTGSVDNTKEIVKAYTNRIFDFEWIDNFAAARNYSFSKATKDYILWLDADDVLLEEDRSKLKDLKENLNPGVDVIMMKYNTGVDESGNVLLSYFRERLVKRVKNFRWHEPVHEYLDIKGNIFNSDIVITHQKEQFSANQRNLAIYEKNIAKGVDFSTRGLYYYARELYYNERYDEAIAYYTIFLEASDGWVEDKISACFDLALCYSIKGEQEKRFKILLEGLGFDTPRAEICCQLGHFHFEREDYKKAIVWYRIATQLEKPEDTWGFIYHDYWGYIPNIQLCVCYDKLGEINKAIHYNNIAGEYKPNELAVIHNREYFESLTGQKA